MTRQTTKTQAVWRSPLYEYAASGSRIDPRLSPTLPKADVSSKMMKKSAPDVGTAAAGSGRWWCAVARVA